MAIDPQVLQNVKFAERFSDEQKNVEFNAAINKNHEELQRKLKQPGVRVLKSTVAFATGGTYEVKKTRVSKITRGPKG